MHFSVNLSIGTLKYAERLCLVGTRSSLVSVYNQPTNRYLYVSTYLCVYVSMSLTIYVSMYLSIAIQVVLLSLRYIVIYLHLMNLQGIYVSNIYLSNIYLIPLSIYVSMYLCI
jgi:hypothetical protein